MAAVPSLDPLRVGDEAQSNAAAGVEGKEDEVKKVAREKSADDIEATKENEHPKGVQSANLGITKTESTTDGKGRDVEKVKAQEELAAKWDARLDAEGVEKQFPPGKLSTEDKALLEEHRQAIDKMEEADKKVLESLQADADQMGDACLG